MGGIGRFFKALGIAIANFFSGKIGGISGPGFRTPPTFPGNTPSTISVSSGKNVNFRTPPFVNGFAGSSVGGVGSFIDGESGNCGGPGERPCINGITLRVETWELEKDLLGIALEFAQKSDLPGIHYHPDPDEPDHLEMGITWGALLKVLARWGLRAGRGAGGSGAKGTIRAIALGKDIPGGGVKGLAEQTGSSLWRNWARDGITRRTVYNRFGRAFHQAADRADVIHFSLDGISNVNTAVRSGAAGFRLGNFTNAELHYIANNPHLLQKTIFYRGGQLIRSPF